MFNWFIKENKSFKLFGDWYMKKCRIIMVYKEIMILVVYVVKLSGN